MFLPRKRPESQPKKIGSASSSIVAEISEFQQSEKPKNPFAAYKAFKAEVRAEEEARKKKQRAEAEEAARLSGRPSDKQTRRSKEWDSLHFEQDLDSGVKWMAADLRASGISRELADLNWRYVSGVEAQNLFLPLNDLNNQSAIASFRNSSQGQAINSGGWVVETFDLAGNATPETPYFKPQKPRTITEFKGFGKVKKESVLKYENRKDSTALPILLQIDPISASKIWERYDVTPIEGEYPWQTIKRCNLPVIVTEGAKKAACLIANGYAAIALRGVTTWHPRGEKRTLYPGLDDLATTGREITICFDSDDSINIRKNVNRQIKDLGYQLRKRGCSVKVAQWLSALGKGVDDAVVANGTEWLAKTLEQAIDFKSWNGQIRPEEILQAIEALKALPVAPTQETEGRFLPDLPYILPKSGITILEAPTGSGKTVQIARQAKEWISNGGIVICLYSLVSLGQQTAAKTVLPHTSEFDLATVEGFKLWCSSVAYHGGAVLCFDSLHRLPQSVFDKPVLLILDEANQGLDHLVSGGTLGVRQKEIVTKFSELARQASKEGAIILSEAQIYRHSLETVQAITGAEVSAYYKHSRNDDRGVVKISTNLIERSGGDSLLKALSALRQKQKVYLFSDSQRYCRAAERVLKSKGFRVCRIDSSTNREGAFDRFFDNPNAWLEENIGNYDCLIVSPSVRTGVSIEYPCFDLVVGYHTSSDPDCALQMLGRYRPSVPRFIWIPKLILTIGDQSLRTVKAIEKRLDINSRFEVAAFGLEFTQETEDLIAVSAITAYHCASEALRGLQKSIAADCLENSLLADGFEVQKVKSLCFESETDFEVAGLEAGKAPHPVIQSAIEIAAAHTENELEDGGLLAAATPYKTVEEANKVLSKPCSLEAEFRARKTIYLEKYLGLDLSDPVACYHYFYRSKGRMVRGVEQQASIENLEILKGVEAGGVEAALKEGLKHKIPSTHTKALLLHATGILDLLADDTATFTNESAELHAIRDKALKFRGELKYYFGIDISFEYLDEQKRKRHTPIEVCGKLLKRLGLRFSAIHRTGKAERQRTYQIVPIVPKNPENLTKAEQAAAYQVDIRDSWKRRNALLESVRKRYQILKRTQEAAKEQQQAKPQSEQEKEQVQNCDHYYSDSQAVDPVEPDFFDYSEAPDLSVDAYGFDLEDWGV